MGSILVVVFREVVVVRVVVRIVWIRFLRGGGTLLFRSLLRRRLRTHSERKPKMEKIIFQYSYLRKKDSKIYIFFQNDKLKPVTLFQLGLKKFDHISPLTYPQMQVCPRWPDLMGAGVEFTRQNYRSRIRLRIRLIFPILEKVHK